MAVVFAILAAAMFGLLAVGLRIGLGLQPSPDAGIAATGLIAVSVSALIAAASGLESHDFSLHDLWPFLAVGTVVPGASQLLLIRAIRDAGASRASIVIGTAPLLSALLAITLLHEPFKAGLAVATLLIVSGGVVLAREQARPEHFKLVGLLFALACAWLFAGRDNVVRWAATDTDPNPLVAAASSMAVASAVTLAATLARGHARLLAQSFRPYLLAGLSLGLAYTSLLVAFDRGRVVVVAPLNATQSLFAVAFAAILLKRTEMIGPRLIVAAALIVAGGALVGAAR